MTDKEKKSTMKGFETNDQADYYSGITSITVNGKNAYELKGKFLDDLHNNAFSGTNGEDAVEHIEYFLKIVDPIDLSMEAMKLSQSMEKTLNLEETNQDDEQEIGEIFRIETKILLALKIRCSEKFKEFNYLLKIDPNVLTSDIVGFKTYDEYKDDWIYEWNKNVPWREDGYCNGGNLPGAYIVGNTLHYQDLEWYDALKDSELKEEALRNKAIMEGLINEDIESNNEGWKSWDDFEITNGDCNKWEYENEHEDDERYKLYGNETNELPVCTVRRFEMIKYSFGQDEEYVAIKEDEYEDLMSTSKDACQAYQEIFACDLRINDYVLVINGKELVSGLLVYGIAIKQVARDENNVLFKRRQEGARKDIERAFGVLQGRHLLSFMRPQMQKTFMSSSKSKDLEVSKKFTSVWHVVAIMIRGQPGLDELEFDDLYNNLKVSQGCTIKQSTVEPAHIPKGYNQTASSKVQTAPNCASHSDEIICSFFAQQASMPTTHDDEDLLQIDEDAMEEIDIRWQVAMITARIRKFMRKTGRPIDLKPKNGITFDKSKIECFNCQKLGHFARECRFAKYQENRANGRQEKRIVAIEDSNSKALVATDNNDDIDWTKEFDAEPMTFAMIALTGLEEDDWSMEIDSEPMHFGQDGLGDFDWSNTADDTPVSLALMATNSEVPYCSKCSKSYKKLLENYQTERDNFQKARTEILGYQMSLESLEVILKTHEKNEYAWGDKYEQMEYDLKMRDLKLEEKQKELDQALKERDDFKVKLEKWSNAAVLQNEVLNKQRYLSDKTCIGFGVEYSSSEENNNSSGGGEDENFDEFCVRNFKREKGPTSNSTSTTGYNYST
ncbi:ribonuclease H-like domain-containing protein [Tanacetum coccineum]|uniref:Ribonuclease H-like domain-containing protein n=1 Tax=Tanacetum coccineum TaxID=301880 RepID=A0ABQ5EN80_9ASTR